MSRGVESFHERTLIGEDAQLVAGDHVETEKIGVQKRWGASAGYHRSRIQNFDITHRASKLTFDFCVDEFAHDAGRLVVHHRIPNGPAVLHPVQVDWSVRRERIEIVGAAIVLVDHTTSCIGNDQRRIAARSIGDGGFTMDGDSSATNKRLFDTIDSAKK